MARIRRAVAALLLIAAFAVPAYAQSLQRLTVTQLRLSSDDSTPKVEVPFNLIVTAHVKERVDELRDVRLPVLTDVELLGDERSVVTDASGTTYTERVRVVAHHSGTITIAPVTIDAIDARDGKPKRYSSNSLTLVVGGGASEVIGASASASWLNALRNAVLWMVGLAALVAIIVALARRRRPLPPVVPQPQPQPPPAPPPAMTREQLLRDATSVLAAERSRSAVIRVRHVVREMVGASDDETLADVLRRAEPLDPPFRALLFALERAAFIHDDGLQPAIDGVLVCLNEAVA